MISALDHTNGFGKSWVETSRRAGFGNATAAPARYAYPSVLPSGYERSADDSSKVFERMLTAFGVQYGDYAHPDADFFSDYFPPSWASAPRSFPLVVM
jgi:hypothetical protein